MSLFPSSVLEVLLMKVECYFVVGYVALPSSVREFFSIRMCIASQQNMLMFSSSVREVVPFKYSLYCQACLFNFLRLVEIVLR